MTRWPICHPGMPWRTNPKSAVHPYVRRIGDYRALATGAPGATYICLGCGQTLTVAVKFVA